jgi:MFS family permease
MPYRDEPEVATPAVAPPAVERPPVPPDRVELPAQPPLAPPPPSSQPQAPGPPASGRRRVLTSLEVPQFRWLFASNTTFFLAMGGQQVLRSWLVFQITGSELALGWVSALVALPMLFIAPIGGAMADRVDRRRVVAGGQLIVVLGELTILALLLTDRLQYWHLLVMAGIMGTSFPFIMPARQAIIADVVGRARMSNAMALNMAAVNTTRVVGPAVAGFAIGAIGVTRAYAVNVVLYIAALTCIAGLRSAKPALGQKRGTMRQSVNEGLRYILHDRLMLVLLFFGLVPMFLVMPFQNLLVVFTEQVWHVGPEILGLLSASAGAGGLVGAVLVAWRSESKGRLRSMMLAAFAFSFFLFLFALSPWYLLAMPLVFLANVFANYYSALNNIAIQMLVPDEVRGRVSSFLMMSFSLPLLGTLPVAAVAELVGAPAAVAGASVIAVLVALVFYVASPSLRGMDERLRRSMLQ